MKRSSPMGGCDEPWLPESQWSVEIETREHGRMCVCVTALSRIGMTTCQHTGHVGTYKSCLSIPSRHKPHNEGFIT